MLDNIKNLTDLAKFFIILLLYTGYMTWWASGVSHSIETIDSNLGTHIIADNIITRDTISLGETVSNLQVQQTTNSELLIESIQVHAKCSAIMDMILDRLEKLENN